MDTKLAINGGPPVRETMLPYGRQWLDDDDLAAVLDVLRSDWITTGPKVAEFERVFADIVGVKYAVAVSSGTAALHAAMFAIGIGSRDEVIVPPMTFAASANCVLYQGGMPVFTDVDARTLLIDPSIVSKKITTRTKAILAVDFAGQACDYDLLREISSKHNLALVADACHALGGCYKGRAVGSLADISTFSFHPVKHVTTGEGGMITTDDEKLAERMRVFRNHGITTDHRQREELGSWFYEMVDLGFNYRLTDIQCALGINQLRKLHEWVFLRNEIADKYSRAFSELDPVVPLDVREDIDHAYHIYMIQIMDEHLSVGREEVFKALRAEGIGVNVHYIPIHLHPYYQQNLGTLPGLCPVAESTYSRLITLPIFPRMSDDDVKDVIKAVTKVVLAYQI